MLRRFFLSAVLAFGSAAQAWAVDRVVSIPSAAARPPALGAINTRVSIIKSPAVRAGVLKPLAPIAGIPVPAAAGVPAGTPAEPSWAASDAPELIARSQGAPDSAIIQLSEAVRWPSVVAPETLPDLKLDGVVRRGESLYQAGRELEPVGRGQFGAVYAHPKAAQAVIKMMIFTFASWISFGAPVDDVFHWEVVVTQQLAQAGAGPRFMGTASIPAEPSRLRSRLSRLLLGREPRMAERPAVLKGRVFGENAEDIIAKGRFTRQDYDLVQDMLRRMADKRIRVFDLRVGNIVIGTTVEEPRRRAYLVDGGWLLPVEKSESAEGIFQSLKHYQTNPIGGIGTGNWMTAGTTLEDALQEGLRRSSRISVKA